MTGNVQEIALKEIKLSKFNPRKHFDEQKLKELANSITEKGIIEPLIVRPVNGKYELVCGERRFKASEKAELKAVPAVIRELTDTQAMEFQVIENLQREDLDPIDEALGYKAMLSKCGYTQEQLAAKVGKSQAYIANRMRLLELKKDIQDSISRGIISPGHAMVILRIQDPKVREELFKRVVEQKWSVRRAENELNDFGKELKNVPFDRAECKGCMFQGENQEDLIDKDTNLKGMCLNPSCFMKKAQAFIQSRRDKLKKKGFQVTTEEQLEKKNLDRYSAINLGNNRKELGKAYKTKCLENCPNHWYVIRTHDWGPQKDMQYIEEWCTNSACCNRLMYPEHYSQGSSEGKQERQNQGKVQETKRRVWIKEISERVNDRTAKVMLLQHLAKENSLGYFADVFKSLGIGKKSDESTSWYDLEEPFFSRAYDVPEKISWKEIVRLIVQNDVGGYDDEDLDFLALKLGFDLRRDFIIDEPYLKTRTKDQLVALAKEIGLTKHLQAQHVCEPGKLAGKKKTEMIDCFLKKGFDLKGNVPKEIQKKEKGE